MKITIVDELTKHEASVTLPEGGDIYEVAESLRGLLIAYGFHEDSVDEVIITERGGER